MYQNTLGYPIHAEGNFFNEFLPLARDRMPSCKARGISHAIFGQCTEYFELRRALLTGLTRKEMEFYGENAEEMMANEVDLLHNFGPCPREEDCVLLAGHLRLVQSLLSCDGVSKVKVGVALIQTLLDLYLFPASKVVNRRVIRFDDSSYDSTLYDSSFNDS